MDAFFYEKKCFESANRLIERFGLTDTTERLIYGSDNRSDIYEFLQRNTINIPEELEKNLENRIKISDNADSVVSLIDRDNINLGEDNIVTLKDINLKKRIFLDKGRKYYLSEKERFKDQPSIAFGTGFLISNSIIATAGHCIEGIELDNIRFVFNYQMLDEAHLYSISKNDIYVGKEVLKKKVNSFNGLDFALIKLNRNVIDHNAVKVRTEGFVNGFQSVYVIGHPCGLPVKIDINSRIVDNSNQNFFVTNLDAYQGNSGSPVFNKETHKVEGILVRGCTDFILKNGFWESMVINDHNIGGEECTRITKTLQYWMR